MNLNLLDLQVSDIHVARAFFETHFGLSCPCSSKDEMAMMVDEADLSLGVRQ
ncbi:hypothetical protein IAD21_02874 [Abditibacteriota bacterium]|nr:hypothetical protein IAD21_02874 [Abditibacteriota bacterium]